MLGNTFLVGAFGPVLPEIARTRGLADWQLGVVAGEFSFVGADLVAVACDIVSSLLTPRSEMVTLVCGADAPADLAARVEEFIRSQRVDLDVVVYDGGQENYPLFIAVE